MDDWWQSVSWKLCSKCITSWLRAEISPDPVIFNQLSKTNLKRHRISLSLSFSLTHTECLLIRFISCIHATSLWPACLLPCLCCVAIFTRENVQSCLPHCPYTLYDCSPSLFSSITFLFTFIDPTLAKIVNYSPFIRVSRIRCLKKKCLYHNLNIKSALL